MSLYEGLDYRPLEAMQCGIPVITSNNSSMPEVVGDSGIMLPANDRSRVVEAMRSLLTSKETRNQLAAKALERSKLFSWERCASETANMFLKVCRANQDVKSTHRWARIHKHPSIGNPALLP